jgi:hypothetical protein
LADKEPGRHEVAAVIDPEIERAECLAGVGGGADVNLIAMKVSELLDAVEHGTPVEVGPEAGLTAVALVMACHESSDAGRPVHMEEILDDSRSAYQDVTNRALGLNV